MESKLFQRLPDKIGYRERWRINAKTSSHNRDGAQIVSGRITDGGEAQMTTTAGHYAPLTQERVEQMTRLRKQFAVFLMSRIHV